MKTQKMSENREIYIACKNFTLPPALTALTNFTLGGGWTPSLLKKQQEEKEKGTKEKEGEGGKQTQNKLKQKKSSSTLSENSESD